MARKTDMERDLIDLPIALKRTKSRVRKLEMIQDFKVKHGEVPYEVWDLFGHSEFMRGFSEGVSDATWGDEA